MNINLISTLTCYAMLISNMYIMGMNQTKIDISENNQIEFVTEENKKQLQYIIKKNGLRVAYSYNPIKQQIDLTNFGISGFSPQNHTAMVFLSSEDSLDPIASMLKNKEIHSKILSYIQQNTPQPFVILHIKKYNPLTKKYDLTSSKPLLFVWREEPVYQNITRAALFGVLISIALIYKYYT